MLQLSNASLERDIETPYAETAVSCTAVLFPIKEEKLGGVHRGNWILTSG